MRCLGGGGLGGLARRDPIVIQQATCYPIAIIWPTCPAILGDAHYNYVSEGVRPIRPRLSRFSLGDRRQRSLSAASNCAGVSSWLLEGCLVGQALRIREQTRLRVALADTPDSDIDAWSVCEWAPTPREGHRELSEHERAGVIELSRGVLTGQEARSMGIPAFDPVEIAAIRDGTHAPGTSRLGLRLDACRWTRPPGLSPVGSSSTSEWSRHRVRRSCGPARSPLRSRRY